jgi:glycosyltransferase involved in cell wall biosynthesis
MNVTIVTHKLSGGGLGVSAWNQAKILAENGHEVTYLCEDLGETITPCKNITVVEIGKKRSWRGMIWSMLLRVPLRKVVGEVSPIDIDMDQYSAAVSQYLNTQISDGKLDAVIFRDGLNAHLYWQPNARCKTILGFHGPTYVFDHLSIHTQSINKWLHRITLQRAKETDACYAPSRKMREIAADYYGIPLSDISVVPNSVDTDLFKPAEEPLREAVVIFVGRISREKGAEVLLEIIPKLLGEIPDWTFVMVGNSEETDSGGGYAEHIQERAAESGERERVTWIPTMSYQEIVGVYQMATIFLFPTQFESFGNVCIEAQSCGLPVIASETGAIPELVKHNETGVLVPVGDANGFKTALARLIRNDAERVAMGQAARERAISMWSPDAVAPALEKVLATPPKN